MASLTIRNLDDSLDRRLRVRASEQGTSMEETARGILRSALSPQNNEPKSLYHRIHQRFIQVGGVDLEIPERQPIRQTPACSPRR
ncbi:MAG: plasmid stabilization protein [Gemmatimonadetes bacterium]|jgi:antitoxin FitA|nr:plasmid stabilization protein [Gemmatimonadota bacterium]